MKNAEGLSEVEVLSAIERIRSSYEVYFDKTVTEKEVSEHLTGGNGKLIANWKTNRTTPSQKYVMKCSKETGVSIDYLLFGKNPNVVITKEKKKDIIEGMQNDHVFAARYGNAVTEAPFCEIMLDGILEKLEVEVEVEKAAQEHHAKSA